MKRVITCAAIILSLLLTTENTVVTLANTITVISQPEVITTTPAAIHYPPNSVRIQVKVNGIELPDASQTAYRAGNGTVYLPAVPVLEALQVNITWSSFLYKAFIIKQSEEYTLDQKAQTITKGNQTKPLSVPTVLLSDDLMLPDQFVKDFMDVTFVADQANNSVNIVNKPRSKTKLAGSLTWDNVNQLNIADIAFDGKQYVFVDKEGIYRSTDLLNWRLVRRPTGGQLDHVLWNGKQFIALQEGDSTYTVSPDGTTWTDRKFDAQYFFDDILWDGKKYVIFGRTAIDAGEAIGEGWLWVGGQIVILTSADGITWSKGKITNIVGGSNGDGYMSSIATNGKTCVVVGENGFIARSTDGVNWTGNAGKWGSASFVNTLATLSSVIWDGKNYVAIGCFRHPQKKAQSFIFRSPDGVKWEQLLSYDGEFFALAYANGRYVIVGSSEGTGKALSSFVLESTDSIKWTKSFQRPWVGHSSILGIATVGNRFVLTGCQGTFLGEPQ